MVLFLLQYFSSTSATTVKANHIILLLLKFTTGVNFFVVGVFSTKYAFYIVFPTERWDFETESSKKTLIHIYEYIFSVLLKKLLGCHPSGSFTKYFRSAFKNNI